MRWLWLAHVRAGWLEGQPLRTWMDFTLRQKQRYVPIPPDANRRYLSETRGAGARGMWQGALGG